MTGDWEDMAVVGTIRRPHGIRGEVSVAPETDFPDERFRSGAQVFVKRAAQVETLTVHACRRHQDRLLVTFDGVATRTAAEGLGGAELRVPASALHPLPEGTYYQHDLVGCRVRLTTGALVGEVARYEDAGDAGRLVVRTGRGEVLIPFVRAICVSVNIDRKEIVMEPPEGLLDL